MRVAVQWAGVMRLCGRLVMQVRVQIGRSRWQADTLRQQRADQHGAQADAKTDELRRDERFGDQAFNQ